MVFYLKIIGNVYAISFAHSDDIRDNGGSIAELLQYLDDKDLQIQNITKYKYTKQLFLKYNTPISSSAPLERLFNFAGLILRPRRSSFKILSDSLCYMRT